MTESGLSEFDFPEAETDVEVEAATADALATIYDAPLVPPAKRAAQKAEEYRTLAADTRKLSYRQRLYLRHLLASQMRANVAHRKMNEGVAPEDQITLGTIRSWHRRRDFTEIVNRYTQLALEHAGVGNSAQILLRIDAVVEDALIPQPIVSRRSGEVIGHSVDSSTALKGLELLGKAAGTFRKDEEQSNRVTVVLDFSGEQMQGEQESEVIDGEAHEIKR